MPATAPIIQKEQILGKEELRQLQEAVDIMLAVEAYLMRSNPSTMEEMAEHFAAALAKLEGSGGAIEKIKAAQAYAHQAINEAQTGSKGLDRKMQKRIGYANIYIERLDRRIEEIENKLIVFLNEKKNRCQSDPAFSSAEYAKCEIQAVTILRNLASSAKADIGLAVDIFGLEQGKKPFWKFW